MRLSRQFRQELIYCNLLQIFKGVDEDRQRAINTSQRIESMEGKTANVEADSRIRLRLNRGGSGSGFLESVPAYRALQAITGVSYQPKTHDNLALVNVSHWDDVRDLIHAADLLNAEE